MRWGFPIDAPNVYLAVTFFVWRRRREEEDTYFDIPNLYILCS